MTEYAALPLDRSTKLTSAAFVAAMAGLALTIPLAEANAAGRLIGYGVPALILATAYGWSPRAYRVDGQGSLQIVRRGLWPKTMRIESVELTSALFGLGGIRLAGSGGVFGWYGLFWRSGTGKYRAYVTDRASLVVCDGPDGIIVLSPADRQGFLAAAGAAS